MKTTASDVLIDSIHDWGVDVVFRLPGDGINGIQDALRKEHSEVPNTDFPLRERIRASFDCESPSPVPVMPWFQAARLQRNRACRLACLAPVPRDWACRPACAELRQSDSSPIERRPETTSQIKTDPSRRQSESGNENKVW